MSEAKLEKIYFSVIEWGTYLALFSPLIFIGDYFFPFVVPKTIFFRIVVDIIFIAFILLAISNPKYRPRVNFLTITIAVFLGMIILTSITGVNFERSFWSVFERMTGLLTLFHLFVFYIVLISCFQERRYWEKILSVSILAAVLICFYALFSGNPLTRGGSTIGNSSFLSAYLLFNIFFALILMVMKTGFWRVIYGLSLVLFLGLLFFNPGGLTKGAVLSFIIGIVIFIFEILIYLFFRKEKKLKKIVLFSLILLVLGIFCFFQLDFVKDKIDKLWQSNSLQARLIIWNIAWQAWQERWWLGWGWENFNTPFIKYYNPQLPLTHDIWYDRVHNIILDMGISSGIIGLVSYLAIFGVAIFSLLKLLPKIRERKNILIPLITSTLLVVYFLQNLWVFDMISSYIMFFLTLAFISFLVSSQNRENQDRENIRRRILPLPVFLGAFLFVLTIFVLFWGNIQPARASKFIFKGLALPLEQSILNFQKAFRASSMTKFEGPEHFSFKIEAFTSQSGQNRELLNQGFQLAQEEFRKAILKNPLDFRLHLFLGRHYNNFYRFTGDTEKLILAEKVLERALELGPTNQQVYFIFAQTRFFQGREQEALDFLQKAKDLEPRFFQARWYLVRAYRLIGKYELALLELKLLEKLDYDWQRNIETLKEGIEVLKETGQSVEVLIPLYEKGVEIFPQDHFLWQGLISAYLNSGQKEKAKTAAEKFMKTKPKITPQIEELLKELGY